MCRCNIASGTNRQTGQPKGNCSNKNPDHAHPANIDSLIAIFSPNGLPGSPKAPHWRTESADQPHLGLGLGPRPFAIGCENWNPEALRENQTGPIRKGEALSFGRRS